MTTTPTVIIEPDAELAAELARVLRSAGRHVFLAADLSSACTRLLARGGVSPEGAHGRPTLAELGRRYALEILQQTGGNKTRAAEILGIDRKTLYRLIEDRPSPARAETPPDERAGA